MAIWKVTTTLVIPVEADSREEAERMTKLKYFRQEAAQGTDPDSIEAIEIKKLDDIPDGMASSIPWGNDEDRTIEDIIDDVCPHCGRAR